MTLASELVCRTGLATLRNSAPAEAEPTKDLALKDSEFVAHVSTHFGNNSNPLSKQIKSQNTLGETAGGGERRMP